jgi:hypothetical protein
LRSRRSSTAAFAVHLPYAAAMSSSLLLSPEEFEHSMSSLSLSSRRRLTIMAATTSDHDDVGHHSQCRLTRLRRGGGGGGGATATAPPSSLSLRPDRRRRRTARDAEHTPLLVAVATLSRGSIGWSASMIRMRQPWTRRSSTVGITGLAEAGGRWREQGTGREHEDASQLLGDGR